MQTTLPGLDSLGMEAEQKPQDPETPGARELTSALQLSQGKGCHLSFLSCQGSEELGALGPQVGEPQIPMPQGIDWSWLGHLCA